MRPLRIAILHSRRDANFIVRCQTPLSWLQKEKAIEVLPSRNAWEADVVLLRDQWQAGAVAIVRSLQRHGIRVVADVDEDLFSAPAEHPFAAQYRDQSVQARARQLLETVDLTMAPSRVLVDKLSGIRPRVRLAPNGIDLTLWRAAAKARRRDRVRAVGFAGSVSHTGNLNLLQPALAKLSSQLKALGIHFVCFGFRPRWLSGVLAGAEVVEPCSAADYSIRLARLGLDIALAPLTNSAFNRSRSALKFWEYSAAGAVTVASNLEPYASEIQHGVNGLLVDDKPESWNQSILKLIRDHNLRGQLLDSAVRSLEAHDVSRTAPVLLEALESTNPNRERTVFSLPRTQSRPCPGVDVVIPIYNSPDLTRQAIDAALPELNENRHLILVDDASPDPAIAFLLDEYEGRPWVTIHRSRQNRGFVGSCNLAALELARQDADVILMNADTRPMPGFVRRLAETAGSNPVIGTVTGVSNEGWIASVPDISDARELSAMEHPLVLSPTACGFLLYVKREVIQKYGLFDMAFSPGYCEEVDLSLRIAAEYANVIDPGCWTWHANSASFGNTKIQLSIDHNALIDQRYPHFRFELGCFNELHPLLTHRMRMLSQTRDPRPRVLQVLHSYKGGQGTEKHVRDLSTGLSSQYLSLAVAPQDALRVYSGEIPVAVRPYSPAGGPLTLPKIPVNDATWDVIIEELKPSLIHVHHLLAHPLNLLAKLTDTGIPVIVSIHDHYFVCPDFALQECPGVHECDTCFPRRFNGPAEFQRLRRALLGASLQRAAAVIAPSRAAANILKEVYPRLKVLVIPHGIQPISMPPRRAAAKLRFGMLGNVNKIKGIEVIFKAWPLVRPADGAELHVYGKSEPEYLRRFDPLGIHFHGPYIESDLPKILSEIDIGVLPSQAPETFSYALSEFFAGGVPVVGSDYGALSERIESGINGLKVTKDDAGAWADTLSLLIQDRKLSERIRQGVRPPESITDMCARYAALYREILGKTDRTPGFDGSIAAFEFAPAEIR